MSKTLTETTNISLNIKTVFSLLFKRIVPIILCAVICGLTAFVYYSFFSSPQYTATVSIIVDNRTIGTPTGEELAQKNTSDITASRLLTDTYIAIFSTSSFRESVAANVNNTSEFIAQGKLSSISGTDLENYLSMSAVNKTEILEIQATTSSPQLSVDICYAIMDEAKSVLAETMDQSEVKSVEGDNILIPTQPSSLSPIIRMVLGCVVGGFLACVVVVVAYVIKEQYLPDGAIDKFRKTNQKKSPKSRPAPAYYVPKSAEAVPTANREYVTPEQAPEHTPDQSIPSPRMPEDEAPIARTRPRPRPQRQAPTGPRQ